MAGGPVGRETVTSGRDAILEHRQTMCASAAGLNGFCPPCSVGPSSDAQSTLL
jgi:hypothetical protein